MHRRRPLPCRSARVLRGAVLAGAGAGLAVVGHVLGGGSPPSVGVLVLTLLAAAACVLASDREWTFARLLGALLAVQLFVHVSWWIACGPAAHSAPASTAWQPPSGVLPMVAGHGIAALISAVVLRHFESLFWWFLEQLRGLVRIPRLGFAAQIGPLVELAHGVEGALRGWRDLGAVSRRGPPLLAA